MSAITNLAQKYLDNPDSIPPEYIETAYQFVEDYCQKNNLDLVNFVKDTSNAPLISESVHKALGWAVRMVLKKDAIQTTIENNHSWILNKFTELHNAKYNITPEPEVVTPVETKAAKKPAAKKTVSKAKEAKEETTVPAKKAKPKAK